MLKSSARLLLTLTALCAACGGPEEADEDNSAAATSNRQTCAQVYSPCNTDTMLVDRIVMNGSGRHAEALNNMSWFLVGVGAGGRVETTFNFGANPGPGRWPLYHCRFGQYSEMDFVSSDPNCEGKMNDGLIGFSLPGGRPVSRCRVRRNDLLDIFLSWDTNCEGQQVVGVIGYSR